MAARRIAMASYQDYMPELQYDDDDVPRPPVSSEPAAGKSTHLQGVANNPQTGRAVGAATEDALYGFSPVNSGPVGTAGKAEPRQAGNFKPSSSRQSAYNSGLSRPAASAPPAPVSELLPVPAQPNTLALQPHTAIHRPPSPPQSTSVHTSVDEGLEAAWKLSPLEDFERRRKVAAYRAMLVLLEQGSQSPADLVKATTALSGEEMIQVALERALAGKCGNPLCRNPFVSHDANRIRWRAEPDSVQRSEGSSFCCVTCETAITTYAAQLGDPMQRMKPSVREQLASHAPRRAMRTAPFGRDAACDCAAAANPAGGGNGVGGKDSAAAAAADVPSDLVEVAAQGGGVATMLAEVRERQPHPAQPLVTPLGQAVYTKAPHANTKMDAGMAECQGPDGVAAPGWAASSVAVEGYVPRGRPKALKGMGAVANAVLPATASALQPYIEVGAAVPIVTVDAVHSKEVGSLPDSADEHSTSGIDQTPASPQQSAVHADLEHLVSSVSTLTVSKDSVEPCTPQAKTKCKHRSKQRQSTAADVDALDAAGDDRTGNGNTAARTSVLKSSGATRSTGTADKDDGSRGGSSNGEELHQEWSASMCWSNFGGAAGCDAEGDSVCGFSHGLRSSLKKPGLARPGRDGDKGEIKQVTWAAAWEYQEAPPPFRQSRGRHNRNCRRSPPAIVPGRPPPPPPSAHVEHEVPPALIKLFAGVMDLEEEEEEAAVQEAVDSANKAQVPQPFAAASSDLPMSAAAVTESSTASQGGPAAPVLVFSVEHGDAGADGGMAAMGVLQVAGSGPDDQEGDESEGEGTAPLPASLKLWFPAAAGGIGVCLAKPPGSNTTITKANSNSARGPSSSSIPACTGTHTPQHAPGAPATAHTRDAQADVEATATAAAAGMGRSGSGAAAASHGTGGAAVGGKPGRRFAPAQPKRRSVVMLTQGATGEPSGGAPRAPAATSGISSALPWRLTPGQMDASRRGSDEGQASHQGSSHAAVQPLCHRGPGAVPQQSVVMVRSGQRPAAPATAATDCWEHGPDDETGLDSEAGSNSVDSEGGSCWQETEGPAGGEDLDEARYHDVERRAGRITDSSTQHAGGWDADVEAQDGEFDGLDLSPADDAADERHYEELLTQLGEVALLHRRREARIARAAAATSGVATAGGTAPQWRDSTCGAAEVRGGGSDSDESSDGFEEGGVVAAAPFFGLPPAGFKVEISSFGLLWSLLGDWVTNATVAYITGGARAASVCAAAAEGSCGGSGTALGGDGGELDTLLRFQTPEHIQVRATLATFLDQAIVPLAATLRPQVPLDDMRRKMGGILRTLTLGGPVPSLQPVQWQLLTAALLKALSIHHLPALSQTAFGAERTRLHSFLASAECSEPLFEWLVARLTNAVAS